MYMYVRTKTHRYHVVTKGGLKHTVTKGGLKHKRLLFLIKVAYHS